MTLYAIGDLHLSYRANRDALEALAPHRDDWLIVAGDVAERMDLIEWGLRALLERFGRVIWTPGNHELWSLEADDVRGEARYQALVTLCRRLGVVTPEDPYLVWAGPGGPRVIAPLFLLYDYSFRPPEVKLEEAVAWARSAGVDCADEHFLYPAPYPSRQAWCDRLLASAAARLEAATADPDARLVLVNHFPLREDLVYLPFIPSFSIWCGTQRTRDWHLRYRASVAVTAHLHIRRTDLIDGVRFEEVSLGYPRQWRVERGLEPYLRRILPE